MSAPPVLHGGPCAASGKLPNSLRKKGGAEMSATEPQPTADSRSALISISPEGDLDDADIDLASRRLMTVLGNLDVDHVGGTGNSELPGGAKGPDPSALGELVVTFGAAGGIF